MKCVMKCVSVNVENVPYLSFLLIQLTIFLIVLRKLSRSSKPLGCESDGSDSRVL